MEKVRKHLTVGKPVTARKPATTKPNAGLQILLLETQTSQELMSFFWVLDTEGYLVGNADAVPF